MRRSGGGAATAGGMDFQHRVAAWVSFEAIVESLGGKLPFNSLVSGLVNFDYYEKWMV